MHGSVVCLLPLVVVIGDLCNYTSGQSEKDLIRVDIIYISLNARKNAFNCALECVEGDNHTELRLSAV